jgi:aldose sugar dehydrogenase
MVKYKNIDGPKPDDNGVIFRVNPENSSSASDNPFASTENNRYYAYGIRNSFGIDFDPVSGNYGILKMDRIMVMKLI